MNLHDIIIERSPRDQAAHMERLRAELDKAGYTVVKTEWLDRLNAAILKRGIEA